MKQSKAEKKIQADIIKALKKIKGCVVLVHTASPFSPSGHSDTYGSIDGHSFWGEVKVPGKKATKIQASFLRQVGKGSFHLNTFVWNNVEQAVKDITRLKHEHMWPRLKPFYF